MTNEDFEKLKKDLEKTDYEFDRLKRLYKQQTGENWVRPLRTCTPTWGNIWARQGGDK